MVPNSKYGPTVPVSEWSTPDGIYGPKTIAKIKDFIIHKRSLEFSRDLLWIIKFQYFFQFYE